MARAEVHGHELERPKIAIERHRERNIVQIGDPTRTELGDGELLCLDVDDDWRNQRLGKAATLDGVIGRYDPEGDDDVDVGVAHQTLDSWADRLNRPIALDVFRVVETQRELTRQQFSELVLEDSVDRVVQRGGPVDDEAESYLTLSGGKRCNQDGTNHRQQPNAC